MTLLQPQVTDLDRPAVDVAAFAALLADIGDEGAEMRRALWDSYRQDGDPQVALLSAAAAANDAATVSRLAHGLKSSSAILGARPLAELLQQTEDAAHAGTTRLVALARLVAAEYGRVAEEAEILCAGSD
jgi:HPt (histidine-containing phosphotransfer) domain-containing protein